MFTLRLDGTCATILKLCCGGPLSSQNSRRTSSIPADDIVERSVTVRCAAATQCHWQGLGEGRKPDFQFLNIQILHTVLVVRGENARAPRVFGAERTDDLWKYMESGRNVKK